MQKDLSRDTLRLLTAEEYFDYAPLIPNCNRPWWLQNGFVEPDGALVLLDDTHPARTGCFGLRPVFEDSTVPSSLMQFDRWDETWVQIKPHLYISQVPIWYIFTDYKDYPKSCLRKFLVDFADNGGWN